MFANLVAAVFVSVSVATMPEQNINLYPQATIVSEVSETGLVTTVDASGEIWQFFDDGWMPGDICAMIMSDESTPEIWDDIIVSKSYSGNIENYGDSK